MCAINLIIQPDHGIEPVVAILRTAAHEILVKQFTFDHPGLLDEVIARHADGVAVRVLLNAAKATGERINDATVARLESAGVPVRWAPSHFLVTHEKSLVVDGARAMIATFNFMEKYFSKTRDYGVVLSDPGQVAGIRACFEGDWSGGLYVPDGGDGLSWSPGNARAILCDLIDGAERSIDLAHPKFAEPVIFERICAALKRGVRVRLLCGGKHGLHQPDLMYSFALWRLERSRRRRAGGARAAVRIGLRHLREDDRRQGAARGRADRAGSRLGRGEGLRQVHRIRDGEGRARPLCRHRVEEGQGRSHLRGLPAQPAGRDRRRGLLDAGPPRGARIRPRRLGRTAVARVRRALRRRQRAGAARRAEA